MDAARRPAGTSVVGRSPAGRPGTTTQFTQLGQCPARPDGRAARTHGSADGAYGRPD